MKGFFQKVLTINVKDKTCVTESIPDAVYSNFLGGKGLGTYLLLKKNKPNVDPLSPENSFIVCLGPVTDTKIWGSSRYAIVTKAPLTGGFSESYSGGRVAEFISRTGYDAIILQEASLTPIFLEISDKCVKFHDATDVWGLDTYEAESSILKRLGRTKAGVLVIGPAGENLVRFATVVNNRWRCAGRTGVGAVLGSKKVKGIVFHGEKMREVANPSEVAHLHDEWLEKGKKHVATKFFKGFGTAGLVAMINAVEAFPTRYWYEGRMEGWENISAETLHSKFSVRPRACNRCFLACGRFTTVKEGRHQGLTIDGPEYETIYSFGGLCLIKSLDEIIYLNDLCDRLGMDTISAGNLAAFTIEASQRGRIDKVLSYGDVDAIAALLHDVSVKKGIGAVLAEGIRHASGTWGLEEIAIHVKGMEPAGYDPRFFKAMGLSYAVSDRGACHMRTTAFRAELAGIIPPEQIEGKAEVVIDFEDRLTLADALILCRFYRDIYLWDELGQIIHATTGLMLDKEGLKRLASNIRNATRIFNIREGITSASDTLPRRFFEEPLGSNKCIITKKDFDQLISDYYSLRGWDSNGVPRQQLPIDF